jgi:hypothetical protein
MLLRINLRGAGPQGNSSYGKTVPDCSRSDGIAIHLFQDGTRSYSPIGVHIFTDQLEELYAELCGRGARLSQEIMRKPWGNRDFRVSDDSGNELKFTESLAG